MITTPALRGRGVALQWVLSEGLNSQQINGFASGG
jgi:hypothetical protein